MSVFTNLIRQSVQVHAHGIDVLFPSDSGFHALVPQCLSNRGEFGCSIAKRHHYREATCTAWMCEKDWSGQAGLNQSLGSTQQRRYPSA